MKKHTLTGEQAYNWGKHSDLFQKRVGCKRFGLITFESYEPDGIVIARDARDARDSAVILRENKTYTFYTKK